MKLSEVENTGQLVFVRDQAKGKFTGWSIALVIGLVVAFIWHATWGAYLGVGLFLVLPLWGRQLSIWLSANRVLRKMGL